MCDNNISLQKHIVIMTPCYGGTCNVNYVTSLINTINTLKSFQINVSIEFCRNDSLITRARNNLIGKAMNNPSITHFLFIDSDIVWNPQDILKLIASDKMLIGGIYPIKNYNWSEINNELLSSITNIKENEILLEKKISDADLLRCKIVKYNLNYLDNVIQIENNLIKVRHIATGFMMLRRELITLMQKEYPETKYVDDVGFLSPEECNFTYALFDCGVLEGHYFSEDWMFCERWRKIGGEVFADISIDLTHTGQEDFKGSLIASLFH